jgi:FlaA1/EpsC-like NDP-sugar epimerase
MALVMAAGVRYAWRLYLDRRLRPTAERAEPLLLFGAGEGGDQALGAMLRDPDGRYLPVGLIDDDPGKRHLRLRGVRVLGGRGQIGAAAKLTGATTLLVAVPSADAALVREITELAEAAELTVKVLPAVSELMDGRVELDDIRDLDLTDLLGRHQIELDVDGIAGYLAGKRVLVTGAGGSIGSELCRQLLRFGPAEMVMLDRDESALHAVQLSLTGRAMLDDDDLVLGDIRDIEHVQRVFDQHRPQVVFHAAALKHLTMLERFPGEGVKTNVWGTLAVLEAARAAGVERFVNISTDKAADPTSVLGYSKRIAERLTAHVAKESDGTFVSVRFGNVLGSRGSVLTAFNAQIASGGPLTVTDARVTRYFMTVQEAVQLVIQAAAVGRPGEVLVLDMGEPVRIDDVAKRLAEGAPRAIRVVYTGLRAGEKVHEDLFGSGEVDHRPHHPLVSQVPVAPLSPARAFELDPWANPDEVIGALRGLSMASSAGSLDPSADAPNSPHDLHS